MKYMILDGNSIINRAFYGIKLLSTKEGLYTNGIYGFLNIFLKLMEEENPDGVAVAFDLKAPTFRHQLFDGYKAKRKEMPFELRGQFPLLKEILTAMGIPVLQLEGYEADDILGTVAVHVGAKGDTLSIVTGDRDSLQLVGGGVTVRYVSTRMGRTETVIYDEAKVREDYDVEPPLLIDIKALMGDQSDNIPGVAGVGEKTACLLVREFGGIEKIYENLDGLPVKENVKTKLSASKDMAFLSKQLARICCEVPLGRLEDLLKHGPSDETALFELFKKLEFRSFIERLKLSAATVDSKVENEAEKPEIKQVPDDVDTFLVQLKGLKKPIAAVLLPDGDSLQLFDGEGLFEISRGSHFGQYESFLDRFWQDEELLKYTAGLKVTAMSLLKLGLFPQGVTFDVQLAAYLLDPSASNYNLDTLVSGKLGRSPLEGASAFDLFELQKAMIGEIDENGQRALLEEVELPLALVLAKMEHLGFAVEKNGLAEYGKQLEKRLEHISGEIYEQAGLSFNINSPKQLGEVLFERLGLPVVKKTKTGYSTDIDVLQKLSGSHEVIENLIEYRSLQKLKSTYADGLLKVINQADGRIHTSFNQTVTMTGRLSSTEPNLQNIPVRTAEGAMLRRFFIASGDDQVLLDADYSQIELRILAHIAQDEAMIKAFEEGVDIHTLTASQVFGVPTELVTPVMRFRAKAVNFGIVYGIGDFSLSQDLKISRKEAAGYIERYFDTYKGVRQYMNQIIVTAREQGYVTTLLGRRRYLPELVSSNRNIKSFGERAALNTPIQGTAADIIKIAMVRVDRRLEKEKLSARLILQIHDELIIEAKRDEAQRAAKILKEEMEGAMSLRAPLVAEVKQGKTWWEAKG